jgi:succinylglutamate desuccinylase
MYTRKMYNFSRCTAFILVLCLSEILSYHYRAYKIVWYLLNNLLNYIFQHQTGLKQKKIIISYKVIDLIEYYNIKIKFVFSADVI